MPEDDSSFRELLDEDGPVAIDWSPLGEARELKIPFLHSTMGIIEKMVVPRIV